MKKARFIFKILHTVFTVFFAVAITACVITSENVGAISSALGQSTYKRVQTETDGTEDTDYFKTDYVCVKDLMEDGAALTEEVEAEGAVLLKNEGDTLPMPAGKRSVSLFGVASVDPAYGGEGSSAASNPADPTDVKEGLEEAGFSVNGTLYDFYSRNRRAYAASGYRINDAPFSEVVSAAGVSASFSEYDDAAIVILKRIRGENGDLYYNNPSCDGEGGNYLALNENEKSVLRGVAERKGTTFGKIIVLLNTPNPIECRFLSDPQYKIDAALWIGSVGMRGMRAVGKILSGEINPSGRLSDTFWNEHSYNPAMKNFGAEKYENAAEYASQLPSTTGNSYTGMNYTSYVFYQEGVYVGYRYAETRYYDVTVGRENAGAFDYAQAVAYPFGYGLSYTTFAYEDMQATYSEREDEYRISVTVKNTGSRAGKTAVQVYLQKPYTSYDEENRVEKAAAELAGYAKIGTLAAGESERVTVEVAGSRLASYDAYGHGTYFVDEGDYAFTVADDAHAATDNFLAKNAAQTAGNAAAVKTFFRSADAVTYSKGIENRFDGGDINRYEKAGSENRREYLSRSDWEGTAAERSELSLTQGMVDDLLLQNGDAGVAPDDEAYPTYGQNADLQLIDMRADAEGTPLEPDNEYWETFMDQLTYREIAELVTTGLRKTGFIGSVGKPETTEHNGPTGLTQKYGDGQNGLAAKYGDPDAAISPPYYPCLGILASSFNAPLAERFGKMLGEDALWAGYSGFYGIGLNTHRSPYDGRAFEYYSEDPFLSGRQATCVVLGLQSKGCNAYVKHIAGYEQQTDRVGLSVWCNEQAYREIYLEPFRMAVRQGRAMNAMTSYTRIGVTLCPASRELCTDFLRGECGMRGLVVSDMWKGRYLNSQLVNCMMAGCDLPDSDLSSSLYDRYEQGYGAVARQMRLAAKRILYATSQSNAMNGCSAGTRFVKIVPLWQAILIGVTAGLGAAFVLSTATFFATSALLQKRGKREQGI